MTRHEYDEEASERLHMDVVHAIDDPLARGILALHRDCGSGTGECDSGLDEMPMAMRADWGCETTAVIATHFRVAYPAGADS